MNKKKNSLKIACIQLNSKPDINKNLIKIEKLIITAVKKGVDFITTPENSNIMHSSKDILLDSCSKKNISIFLSRIQELAKFNHVWILLGSIIVKHTKNKLMNRSYLINDKGIIVAKDNAPDLTPSLYKAASGAAEIVNYFRVTNLKRSISELKKYGYWAYGFDSSEDSKSSNINFTKKSILVFGSEGKGMRDLVKKECDEIIKINMQQNKHYQIDSLNVSNAATIALYEFFKS